jgi:hypothetical protein
MYIRQDPENMNILRRFKNASPHCRKIQKRCRGPLTAMIPTAGLETPSWWDKNLKTKLHPSNISWNGQGNLELIFKV